MVYNIRRAEGQDLGIIKKLQERNHYKNLTEEEKKEEGFVSVETSLVQLQKINEGIGMVVAEIDGNVVGYEMPLGLDHCAEIPLLDPFIERIMKLDYGGKSLKNYRIVIAGQIGVDKGHKGKNLAEKLNDEFLQVLKGKYDVLVTEVSNQNPRSLHVSMKKLGFDKIDQYSAEGREWYVLARYIWKKF